MNSRRVNEIWNIFNSQFAVSFDDVNLKWKLNVNSNRTAKREYSFARKLNSSHFAEPETIVTPPLWIDTCAGCDKKVKLSYIKSTRKWHKFLYSNSLRKFIWSKQKKILSLMWKYKQGDLKWKRVARRRRSDTNMQNRVKIPRLVSIRNYRERCIW